MKKLFIVAVITALLTMTTGCGNNESDKDIATTVAVTTAEPTTTEPTEESTEGTTSGAVLSVPQMCYDPDKPRMTTPLGCFGEDEDEESGVEDDEPFTGPTAGQPVGTVHPVS